MMDEECIFGLGVEVVVKGCDESCDVWWAAGATEPVLASWGFLVAEFVVRWVGSKDVVVEELFSVVCDS